MNNNALFLAFKTSLPVMFGYLPLGIGFGILFATELPYHWLFAPLMGLLIYAGAAQYLMIGLLANHAGFIEVFIAILLLNSRHIVYGISMLRKFKGNSLKKWYSVFGLTDETYSLLSSQPASEGLESAFYITLFNQTYWVVGCFIGGFIGSQITFSTKGLEFALPALFMVLAIEQYQNVRSFKPMGIAAAIALFSLFFISNTHMLIVSVVLSVMVLLFFYYQKPARE